jgi:integrase
MPKEATGELRTLADGFAARITIQGRERRDFVLTTCATDMEAAERCKALAGMAARLRRGRKAPEQIVALLERAARTRAGRPWEFVVEAIERECTGRTREIGRGKIPVLSDWAKDWTSGELAKKYPDHVRKKRSSSRDEELLRLYILPHVRDVRVDEFTLTDAELVMASLPETDPRRPTKALSTGTRRHIAQVMARLMRLAVYPGKWREVSPIPAGWLPRLSASRAKECLYPDEDTLLLGGKSVEPGKPDVPVLRRLAYGFLSREGMRTSELASLRWSDLDLKRGRVSLDENKTDDPRDWDLRPDVVEALARWKRRETETEPGDHVFAENGVPLNVMHLAKLLQDDLRRVGVTRPQLFERSNVRQPIRAHDLRATMVTIALANGRSETWISDRTGHRSHEMINAYRRKARTWNQADLGPMHELIAELREATPSVRLPHGLPHKSTNQPNSHFAQRNPMP